MSRTPPTAPQPPQLAWLVFDANEADDGGCTLEAMASVPPHRVAEVLAEAEQVLTWVSQTSQNGHLGPQPLDDGGDWDMLLHTQADDAPPQSLGWSAEGGLGAMPELPAHTRWVSVTLTLAVSAALADMVVQGLVEA